LCLWENLAASHAFFTSADYNLFHKKIQPALNDRKVSWGSHALLNHSNLSDRQHVDSILNSPAIEVALTKVIEGGTAGYYSQFNKVVTRILDEEPGCDGFFISPLIENVEDQLLLINWKTVDVGTQPSCSLLFSVKLLTYSGSPITRSSRRSQGSKPALMRYVTIIKSLSFPGTLLS
jgi:hypothetical protein